MRATTLLLFVALPMVLGVRDHENILAWINYYRSAHGASTLQWDKGLQYKAYEATLQLCELGRLTHDGNDATSLYASSGDATEVDAVKSWYSESKIYCNNGYYNNPRYNDEIGHFTDLVWKSNKKVGTWAHDCNGATYVAILTGDNSGKRVSNLQGSFGSNVGYGNC